MRRVRSILLCIAPMAALLCGFVALRWPFREQAVRRSLEAQSGREVQIRGFRTTYFPPGFVAEDLRFLRHDHPGGEPIIQVKRVVVKARWHNLMAASHVVSEVDVDTLHLLIPPRGAAADGKTHQVVSPAKSTGNQVTLQQMNVRAVTLDFLPNGDAARAGATAPYRLEIQDLRLSNVGSKEELGFEALIRNKLPEGLVHVTGRFGPWESDEPARTPVRADYTFQNAKLSTIPGISGVLQAKGKFWGTLDREQTVGEVTVPDFCVNYSGHAQNVSGDFDAVVDATHGDVALNRVDVRFGQSSVHARGTVDRAGGSGGKTALLQVNIAGGRVQDLERMFMNSQTPPLVGQISLQTAVRLPPGKAKFLERLEMVGSFRTEGEYFRSAKTQGMLDTLRESAAGESKAEQKADGSAGASGMTANVMLRGGVAHIQNLLLAAPATTVRMDGTYSLLSKEVDFHGTMKTDGKLSDTTSGFKAFAVKLITPFLKKQHSTVVPFAMKGTYGNVSTRLELGAERKL